MNVRVLTCKYNMPGESGYDVIGAFDENHIRESETALSEIIDKTCEDWGVNRDLNGYPIDKEWTIEIDGNDEYLSSCHISKCSDFVIEYECWIELSELIEVQ